MIKLLLNFANICHVFSLKTYDGSKELIVQLLVDQDRWIIELILLLTEKTGRHVEEHTLLIALIALVHIDILGLVLNAELLPQSLLVLFDIELVFLLFEHGLLAFKEFCSFLANKHWAFNIFALVLFLLLLHSIDVLLYIVKEIFLQLVFHRTSILDYLISFLHDLITMLILVCRVGLFHKHCMQSLEMLSCVIVVNRVHILIIQV